MEGQKGKALKSKHANFSMHPGPANFPNILLIPSSSSHLQLSSAFVHVAHNLNIKNSAVHLLKGTGHSERGQLRPGMA